jgi:hypothetical protein
MGNCCTSHPPRDFMVYLCYERKWDQVKSFLKSSSTSEEEKIRSLMYKYNEFWTCLHAACSYRAPVQVIQAMIQIGGKQLLKEGTSTALHNACTRRFGAPAEIVSLLVDAGGKDLVMQKDYHGRTALHNVCRSGASVEIVQFLVDAGGKDLVVERDNHGRTALHNACRYLASPEVVQILIEAGGFPLVQQIANHGESALQELRFRSFRYSDTLHIIRALTKVGGRELVMKQNRYGSTALQVICLHITSRAPPNETTEAFEMLKWLREEKLLLKKDIRQYNLLAEACSSCKYEFQDKLFKYLVQWNPQTLRESDHRSIWHAISGPFGANNGPLPRNDGIRTDILRMFRMVLEATLFHFPKEVGLLFQPYEYIYDHEEDNDNKGDYGGGSGGGGSSRSGGSETRLISVLEKNFILFGKDETWQVLQECLEAATVTGILHERDSETNLYPFMIAAAGPCSELSVIYYLFRQTPVID